MFLVPVDAFSSLGAISRRVGRAVFSESGWRHPEEERESKVERSAEKYERKPYAKDGTGMYQ
jgi:hypothetical protein